MLPNNHNQENIHSKGQTSLIAISFWSFGLGFGPLIPIVSAWVFRKNNFLCKQLIQSALIQLLFFIISFTLFIGFILNNYYGEIDKSFFVFTQGGLDWLFKLLLFIFSLIIWNQKQIDIPLIDLITDNLINFCKVKKIKRAYFLNCLFSGLGQLYLGQAYLGYLFIACQITILFSLFHIGLSYSNFSISKDILNLFGFYWRIGDQAFSEQFATLNNIYILSFLLIFNFILSIISLRFKLPQRRIIGSLQTSYLLHFSILWIILLIPFILTKSSTEKAIKQRAEEIEKQLSQIQKTKKQNKITPIINTKEIELNLELPEQIKGLNEFSSIPVNQNKQDKITPNIGFSERLEPLPSLKKYKNEYSRKTKSYSEYLTSKVREGNKDQIIWDNSPELYSTVVEYIISPEGQITNIQILEHSSNIQIDSMVISVLESMAPLKKPTDGKMLKITELFWNTQGDSGLETDLKRSLVNYPDGRIIEEVK